MTPTPNPDGCCGPCSVVNNGTPADIPNTGIYPASFTLKDPDSTLDSPTTTTATASAGAIDVWQQGLNGGDGLYNYEPPQGFVGTVTLTLKTTFQSGCTATDVSTLNVIQG